MRRHQGVARHVDAPGQRGVDAVVAVAGGEAADAAYAVADGRGRSGKVHHSPRAARAGEAVGPGQVSLQHKHGDSGQQASEPGKAGLEPVQEAEEDISGMRPAGGKNLVPGYGQQLGVLQLVPGLGADDAGDDYQRDHVQRVGVDAVADEVPV